MDPRLRGDDLVEPACADCQDQPALELVCLHRVMQTHLLQPRVVTLAAVTAYHRKVVRVRLAAVVRYPDLEPARFELVQTGHRFRPQQYADLRKREEYPDRDGGGRPVGDGLPESFAHTGGQQ